MAVLTSPDGWTLEFEHDEDVAFTDEDTAKFLGISKNKVACLRREMRKLPSQQKYLVEGGDSVTFLGIQSYRKYRKTDLWYREKAKIDEMAKKSKTVRVLKVGG